MAQVASIFVSAEQGDIAGINAALEGGQDLNAKNDQGQTALRAYALVGAVNSVRGRAGLFSGLLPPRRG